MLGRKEPFIPKEDLFRQTKGPHRRTKGFPGQHNARSGQQMAILSLKGLLVGRKGPFVGLKKALIRPTQEDFKPRLSLAETEPLFDRNRALLGRKRALSG